MDEDRRLMSCLGCQTMSTTWRGDVKTTPALINHVNIVICLGYSCFSFALLTWKGWPVMSTGAVLLARHRKLQNIDDPTGHPSCLCWVQGDWVWRHDAMQITHERWFGAIWTYFTRLMGLNQHLKGKLSSVGGTKWLSQSHQWLDLGCVAFWRTFSRGILTVHRILRDATKFAHPLTLFCEHKGEISLNSTSVICAIIYCGFNATNVGFWVIGLDLPDVSFMKLYFSWTQPTIFQDIRPKLDC